MQDIIICGHSHCGAMNGVLHPEQLGGSPAVEAWLSHAEATQRIIRENHNHLADEIRVTMPRSRNNVLVQLDNLRTHPCVATALSCGSLKLHGCVYKFETGQVLAYEPQRHEFLSLDQVFPRQLKSRCA